MRRHRREQPQNIARKRDKSLILLDNVADILDPDPDALTKPFSGICFRNASKK